MDLVLIDLIDLNMKHLIKNNIIVVSGLPESFYSLTLEKLIPDYPLQDAELHKSDGWVEEIVPQYTSEQVIGDIYYDNSLKLVTHYIVDKKSTYTIEELKLLHYQDLDSTKSEINDIIKDLNNKYNPLGTSPERIPTALKDFLIANHPEDLDTRAKTEIEALTTQEESKVYIIKGTEINGYINYLKSFL